MDYTPDNNFNPVNNSTGFPDDAGSTHHTPSPSDIYNATAPGNTPAYHYGYGAPQNFFNPQYVEEQRRKELQRKLHEKRIKSLGTNTGIILLLVLGLSFLLSIFLSSPEKFNLYNTDVTFASGFGIFYSVISVGLAFFIGSFLFKNSKALGGIPYNIAEDKTKAVLLVFMGFGGCLVANYITVFLRTFAESFGIYSSYTAMQEPSSTMDVIMLFVGTAIVPPLIEEFAIRGVLMQSLRKYGDAFAIITSAFVFGIFHGNAVQMPFAFLCGLAIGYAVIATESLWTGIIIHAVMNAMSAVSSALLYYFDEYTSNQFFYIASAIGIIFGVLATILYINRYKSLKSAINPGSYQDITLKDKFIKFNTSPVMTVAIVLYAINAITELTTTPPTY